MQEITCNHCINYGAVIEKKTYSELRQTFKMERFAQRIIPECRCAMRKFSRQEREGIVESGYFDKHFVKNTRERGPTG